MKRLYTLIFLFPFCSIISAQFGYDFIDINNIKAKINSAQPQFSDLNGGLTYEVPKGSGKSTIFAAGLWVGGVDGITNLRLASQLYNQGGTDFWAGPEGVDSIGSMMWDRIWKINKSSIDSFIQDCSDGTINNPIPLSILQWPANGNPNLPMPGNGKVAPFVDKNGDGIYNPQNFDYPLIKGDQMLWSIFNDNRSHTESGGIPLRIEVQLSAYAFKNTSDVTMNNTIFLNYKIKNKSTNSFDSTYIGTFVDIDLGYFADDFIGSDSANHSFFGYNGDPVDDTTAGAKGYGLNIPVQSVTFLNHNINSFMYFQNDFTVRGSPLIAQDYYNYMRAQWKNYKHLTFGGNGYGGTKPTNFMFPDNPNLPVPAWSECSGANIPGDRRGVGNFGPFTFQSGETKEVDIALITHWGIAQPCPNLNQMKQNINHIDSTYQVSIKNGIPVARKNSFGVVKVTPNPFQKVTSVKIKMDDQAKPSGTRLIVNDIFGKEILSSYFINDEVLIERKDIASGIYYYTVMSDKGVIYAGKLVVE